MSYINRLLNYFYITLHYIYDDIVFEFGEIVQNKGHFAVQRHSKSPIFVPIESSYTTYQNDSLASTAH